MTTFSLRIDGMTCEGCVRSVTNAVMAVPGVTNVAATLADGAVVVTIDDGVKSDTVKTDVIEAITDAGFDVV